MAQAFDLAGAKNIVGAPSFAHLAKGGNLERMRDRVAEPQKLCRQDRYPPLRLRSGQALAKNARTGHLSIDGAHRHHQKGGPLPGRQFRFRRVLLKIRPLTTTISARGSATATKTDITADISTGLTMTGSTVFWVRCWLRS